MSLLVFSSHVFKYKYRDGVDITRSGVDKARKANLPTPGLIWAPSAALVYPAVEAMKSCRALMKIGTAMAVKGRASGSTMMRELGYDKMHAAMEQTIIVWNDYVTAFMIEMRHSWKANRSQWNSFLAQEEVTLLCRCEDAAHCHRRILRTTILPTLGARDGGEHQISEN